MTDDELKQQLVEIATELYRAGLITGNGGNVSVRSVDHPNAAWITPSQIFKGALHPDQMVLIDMDGKRIAGDYKPSVESGYHAGLMRVRPEVNSVIHTHAPFATVFGASDMRILPITTEAAFMLTMPVIPFLLAGSKDLAKQVIEHVGTAKTIGAFLRNHGLITIGKDLRSAADHTFMVEHTLRILFTMKTLGIEPCVLPAQAVKLLSQFAGVL